MIIIWNARIRFLLEQAWFLEVGSNNGGKGELSFHFNIKINVGFIRSSGALSEKFGIYVHQTTIFRGVLNNYPTCFLSPYYYLIL